MKCFLGNCIKFWKYSVKILVKYYIHSDKVVFIIIVIFYWSEKKTVTLFYICAHSQLPAKLTRKGNFNHSSNPLTNKVLCRDSNLKCPGGKQNSFQTHNLLPQPKHWPPPPVPALNHVVKLKSACVTLTLACESIFIV